MTFATTTTTIIIITGSPTRPEENADHGTDRLPRLLRRLRLHRRHLIGLLFMADPDRELANAPFDLLPAARTPVTVVDTAEIEVFSGVQFS